MWRKFDPSKRLLNPWMSDDTLVVQHVSEKACPRTGKTITVQADLVHVDGTLLYQAVKPGCDVVGIKPQVDIGRMAWAIKCNAHLCA